MLCSSSCFTDFLKHFFKSKYGIWAPDKKGTTRTGQQATTSNFHEVEEVAGHQDESVARQGKSAALRKAYVLVNVQG